MGITLRHSKGSPLTHNELDANFQEFYYSASYTDYHVSLFKSKSLESEFTVPVNVAKGPQYSIQLKVGSEATGSQAAATGSSNFTYDFTSDQLRITGSAILSGSGTILNVKGDSTITGDLVVGGTVTAEEFITERVATSYIYKSGSTKFGDTSDDRHDFTGSLGLLGNATLTGDLAISGHSNVSESISAGSQRLDTLEGKTLVSASAQIAADISGSLSNFAIASLGAGIVSSSAQIASQISGSTDALSASISSVYLTNTTDTLTGDLEVTGNLTASNALFTNIVVNGTGSFIKIESVTGSAKIIGDAFIQLNESTPAQRYAGLQVVDSGSTFNTASFFFDGLENNWMYEYTADSSDYALALFGPEFSTKGSPVSLTANTVPIATGSHHLVDSNITDDGSTVTVTSGTFAIPGFPDVSASLASTVAATGADWNVNLVNIPDGLVSSSIQVDADSITNFDTNVKSKLDADEVVSGSNISFDGSTLTVTGDIDATGDITAYASSDERLKDNITPISNPIEKVKAIGGYTYNWNGLQDKHILGTQDVGVIAQEIEEVLPELVATRESGYKAVRYDKIVALLIEAIKDQQSQIEDLKSRL